jgi:hypothetical protein
MADADDVRRIALALPHVVEIDSDGFDFRVGNKGFVWSWPERRPGRPRVIRTDVAVLFVGDEAEKQALLLGEPDVFFTAPGYEEVPLVLLRLAAVDEGRLAELVTDAFEMRADACTGRAGRSVSRRKDPVQPAGQPPVAPPEHGHRGRQQHRPHDRGVDQHGGGQADAHLLELDE